MLLQDLEPRAFLRRHAVAERLLRPPEDVGRDEVGAGERVAQQELLDAVARKTVLGGEGEVEGDKLVVEEGDAQLQPAGERGEDVRTGIREEAGERKGTRSCSLRGGEERGKMWEEGGQGSGRRRGRGRGRAAAA